VNVSAKVLRKGRCRRGDVDECEDGVAGAQRRSTGVVDPGEDGGGFGEDVAGGVVVLCVDGGRGLVAAG